MEHRRLRKKLDVLRTSTVRRSGTTSGAARTHPICVTHCRWGTDTEGGYLVPDEFEHTLVTALEEENLFRSIARIIQTASGDRKIPISASKGEAAWIDEEGTYPESDDSFGQVTISAYKLGTIIKVSEELINDSVFDIESYIATEFARRIGAKEEAAFFTGGRIGQAAGYPRRIRRGSDRRQRGFRDRPACR